MLQAARFAVRRGASTAACCRYSGRRILVGLPPLATARLASTGPGASASSGGDAKSTAKEKSDEAAKEEKKKEYDDFGLDQPAPRSGDILTTRVLSWPDGMEWIDISCAVARAPRSPDDTPEKRRSDDAQWSAQLEQFRASLVPVLTKLDVPSVAITRASQKHALPGILAVEHRTRGRRSGLGISGCDDDVDIQQRVDPAHTRELRHALSPPPRAASGGISFALDNDVYLDSGETGRDGAFCPLRMPGSARGGHGSSNAAAIEKEAEDITAVCALLRYAPHGDDSEVAVANRRIDTFNQSRLSSVDTKGSLAKTTAKVATQGFSRAVRALTNTLSRESLSLSAIEEITNRITLFVQPHRLVTVHVLEVPFVTRLRHEWDAWYRHSGPLHVVNAIVKGCSRSFRDEAAAETLLLDRLESVLFRRTVREYDQALQLLYAVSRRASIHARVLAPMPATHASLCLAMGVPTDDLHVQDVQTSLKTARILCAEVRNSTQGLLSLHFQRSASELESMMRVLTIFSAIFIPLELITAVFGANFEHWWANDVYGFGKACCIMAVTSGVTIAWFRFKRFV